MEAEEDEKTDSAGGSKEKCCPVGRLDFSHLESVVLTYSALKQSFCLWRASVVISYDSHRKLIL